MLHGEEGWMRISREMGNRSDVQCRYHYLQLTRSGREADLVEQINATIPGVSAGLVKTPEESLQRQFAQSMRKKKGRPMKHPLITFNSIPIPEDGSSSHHTSPQSEEVARPPTACPLECLIDWSHDSQDENIELMTS
jgi:hypothetical protein